MWRLEERARNICLLILVLVCHKYSLHIKITSSISYFWRVCCELQSFFLFSHCPLSWSKQYWQWRMTLLRPFSLNWETLRKLQVFPVIVATFFPMPEFYSLSHFLYKLLLQDAGSSQVRCSVPEPSLTNWEDDASWKRKSHSAKQGQTLSRKLCWGWGQQHPTAAWVQEEKKYCKEGFGKLCPYLENKSMPLPKAGCFL